MSTVVTQAEFCATTVTQADYSTSAASSAVSSNDFRRAWITPNPENLTGLAERNTTQHQYAGVKLTVTDAKLTIPQQQLQVQPKQQQQQQQQSIDHDDEVALHPLSNQVKLHFKCDFFLSPTVYCFSAYAVIDLLWQSRSHQASGFRTSERQRRLWLSVLFISNSHHRHRRWNIFL